MFMDLDLEEHIRSVRIIGDPFGKLHSSFRYDPSESLLRIPGIVNICLIRSFLRMRWKVSSLTQPPISKTFTGHL